jgi:hypothetical protein
MRRVMSERSASIETMEHRYMRAWISGDARALKAMTSRRFRMVIGTKPCVMLDSKSWLDAASSRFACREYRFGDVYTHDLGSTVVFATQVEATMQLDLHAWSGTFWVTDVWRRGSLRRSWRIVDRSIARLEADPDVPNALRALQLWGPRRAARMELPPS